MTTGPAPAFGAFTTDELDTTVTAAAIIDSCSSARWTSSIVRAALAP